MHTSLADRLLVTAETVRRVLKPELDLILTRNAATMRSSGLAERSLHVGDAAPPFTLPDFRGRAISSATLGANGPLVVAFVRGTWCPFCATELAALGEAYDRIRAAGAELVAIAPQSSTDAAHYDALNPLPFPLLIDGNAATSRAYGLTYEVPENVSLIYRGVFGVNLRDVKADRAWFLPMPSRFVIDRGTIVDARVEPDFRLRVEPDETIAFIEQYRAAAAG